MLTVLIGRQTTVTLAMSQTKNSHTCYVTDEQQSHLLCHRQTTFTLSMSQKKQQSHLLCHRQTTFTLSMSQTNNSHTCYVTDKQHSHLLCHRKCFKTRSEKKLGIIRYRLRNNIKIDVRFERRNTFYVVQIIGF